MAKFIRLTKPGPRFTWVDNYRTILQKQSVMKKGTIELKYLHDLAAKHGFVIVKPSWLEIDDGSTLEDILVEVPTSEQRDALEAIYEMATSID